MKYYKVVTYDLKSLGLRKNPTIMTFPTGKWVYEPNPTYDKGGYGGTGGIWVANGLSQGKGLLRYMIKKSIKENNPYYAKCRLFEVEIGNVLYQNSYRTKTDRVKLVKELTPINEDSDNDKYYNILCADGVTRKSKIPGKYAGYKPGKIFGTLDCKSGKRMNKKNRVFFHSMSDAIKNGYRPCKNCKPMNNNDFKNLKHIIPYKDLMDFYNRDKKNESVDFNDFDIEESDKTLYNLISSNAIYGKAFIIKYNRYDKNEISLITDTLESFNLTTKKRSLSLNDYIFIRLVPTFRLSYGRYVSCERLKYYSALYDIETRKFIDLNKICKNY